MKPINIKISAFGPYKDEIKIDFTKLGENGIFLITGDTGAGKTSVFDAISFALFGDVSGSNRPIHSLRSNFADIDTETFVELEFMHKGKTYKIRRNPAYDRPKKRGEGVTPKAADASLEYDEEIITGFKNVDIKIEEILGINARQFKQIAMLAQGEFLKILFAESKERTEVFRKIFDTEIYNIITRLLAEKCKESKDELAQIKNTFCTNVSNVNWKEYVPQISEKTLNQVDVDLILEKLKEELVENEKEYTDVAKHVDNQSKETAKTEEEIKEQTQKNIKIDNYNKLKIEKENLAEKEAEIKALKENIKKSQEIISEVLPKEEKVEENKKEISKIKKELEKIALEIAKGQLKQENATQKIKTLEKMKTDTEKYKTLKISLQRISKIKIEKSKEEKLVATYKKIEEEFKKLNKEYLEKEDEFFREQAGILAEKLEPNKPCPVCGSEKHPCVAQKSQSVLTKEELDKLKNKLEQKNKETTEIKNNIVEIQAQIKILKEDLEENYNDELIQNEFENICEELNKSYMSIVDKKIDLEEFEYDEFKEEIMSKITEDKEKLAEDKALQTEKDKQLNEINEKLKVAEAAYEKAYRELGFETEGEYKKTYLPKEQIDKLNALIEKYNEQVTANNTKLSELAKEVKDLKKVDLKEKIEKLENMKKEYAEIKKLHMEKNRILEGNLELSKKLKENAKQLAKKIDEYSLIEELYKTASGNLPKKKRIEFEQYVQATYFDNVIVEANKRLLKMTDNRFQLIRKENSEKLAEKIALELEVIDNYNGKKRDVKSLSGGESFKAALSLALGLSDVIQSYSGGVVIDTMFIDEGFGSLDTESREQAINTLSSLIGSNKLIGIISHVTELKERIDKKIVVSKTSDGSKIEVEA